MDEITGQLASAFSAHAAWKTRLRHVIDTGDSDLDVETVARDDRCAFGQWLYDPEGDARRSPHFESCRDTHAQFHRAAADVLEHALAGRKAEAEALLGPGGAFARASASVSRILIEWRKEQASEIAGDLDDDGGEAAGTRFPLTAKLVGMTGLFLGLLAAVALVGILGLRASSSRTDAMVSGTVQPLVSVAAAASLYHENEALLRELALDQDASRRAALRGTIARNAARTNADVAAARAAAGRGLPALGALQRDLAAYAPVRKQEISLALAGEPAAAEQVALEHAALTTRIGSSFAGLVRAEAQQARADRDAVAGLVSSRTLLLVVVLLATFAVGGASAFVFSRQLVRGLRRVVTAAERTGAGDFAIDLSDVRSRDEIGELARAFSGMVNQLRGTVLSVAAAASEVGIASQEMASVSDETGRAVNEIAAAIAQVAHGSEQQVRVAADARERTEEMAASASAGAAEAAETTAAAEHARQVAEEGAAAASSAAAAMDAVRGSSLEVTDAIRLLGAKSAEVGGIVELITGIAGQTNLLALNAAIEAARAGEQGRGFAVVAEEVRKLAEESERAAASISSLIGEIQAETEKAVAVVESGAERTEQGVAVVEQARDAFERIASAVEDMTGRVDRISTAIAGIVASSELVQARMAEVSSISEQSSASTEQVSASTQQTSASTESVSSSALELARTAEELERFIGHFQLGAA